MKETDCSVACWYEELQQYDPTVQCRKGSVHSNADAVLCRSTSAESEPPKHHWRRTPNMTAILAQNPVHMATAVEHTGKLLDATA